MPTFNPLQVVGAATTVAAPGSIVTNVAATTQGSGLILCITAALSGAPTVTPPAGWLTAKSQIQGTTIGAWIFYLPNCAAGITSITVTLAGVNGACSAFYEVPNLNTVQPLDFVAGASSAGSTTPSIAVAPSPILSPEFYIACIGNIATQAFTNTSVADRSPWVAQPAAQASTTGATNVQQNTATCFPGSNPNGFGVWKGTLAGSAAWVTVFASFYYATSGALSYGTYGTSYSGSGYSPGSGSV